MGKRNRKEDLQRRIREMSPQRKRALLHNLVGAHLPEIIGSDEMLIDVSDALSPEMRSGLLARLAYDATAAAVKKQRAEPAAAPQKPPGNEKK